MGKKLFIRAVRENALGMLLSAVGAAGTVISAFRLWLPEWAIPIVGVTTALLIVSAAVCFIWFKGDKKCKWEWERPLLKKALGEEENPLLCGHQFTGRAQGRALACAVGVHVLDSIRYFCRTMQAISQEMLLETDFDRYHLAMHLGRAEGLYGQITAVNACDCTEALVTLSEHAEDLVRDKAGSLHEDLASLQENVRHRALVPLFDLHHELMKPPLGWPLSAGDKERVKRELRQVGAFLAAQCTEWLLPVLGTANDLVASLRRRWQKDRDAVQGSVACTPIDLELG